MEKATIQDFEGVSIGFVSYGGDMEIVGSGRPTSGLTPTRAGGDLVDLEEVVSSVALSFGTRLQQLSSELAPDELTLDLRLSFSENLGIWVAGLKGEQAVSVKFCWKKSQHEPPTPT